MKAEINLPKEFLDKYNKIEQKFGKICMDWKKYNDQIIPEDLEFAVEIVDFIVSVFGYIENNYDSIDIMKWISFLWGYQYNFYYGPSGDDRNYLAFDEADLIDIFLVDMANLCEKSSKKKIAKLRGIFLDAKKELQNG